MSLNISTMDLRDYAEAQCKEMQKHRWIESEKAGRDLGESAYLDWVRKYAKNFRAWWNSLNQ
jgi:hypothetical protein